MRIAFFGSSLVSAYWNGAATYYRGIVRALARARPSRHVLRARRLQPPAASRYRGSAVGQAWSCTRRPRRRVQARRRSGARCRPDREGQRRRRVRCTARSRGARLASRRTWWRSGTSMRPPRSTACSSDPRDPFRRTDPALRRDLHLRRRRPGGLGLPALGARQCVPDLQRARSRDAPSRAARSALRAAISAFSAIACRIARRASTSSSSGAAAQLPGSAVPARRRRLGRQGRRPSNIRYFDHVYTRDHNAFNCTPRAVLNISRESMARYGFSPATRVFEAAGAGACLITDAWEGIELFLEPGREVLVAHDGDEVAEHARALNARARAPDRARRRGAACSREHTYAHRAAQVEAVLDGNARRQRRPAAMSDIVILGLSITSSWGNGHATTYRSLVRGLAARGHRVLFLERDQPWYAGNRDEPHPAGATTVLYDSVDELIAIHERAVRDAALVIVGSFVPDGVRSANGSTSVARGLTAFYDIDTPVTLAKLAAGEHEYITPDLIPRLRHVSLVHRRTRLCASSRAATALRWRAFCTALSIPSCIDPPRGRAAGTSAISGLTATIGSQCSKR